MKNTPENSCKFRINPSASCSEKHQCCYSWGFDGISEGYLSNYLKLAKKRGRVSSYIAWFFIPSFAYYIMHNPLKRLDEWWDEQMYLIDRARSLDKLFNS